MKRCPKFLVYVAVALFAVSAVAQFQTGNIYGRVQAKDGSVLPGVTVTLTGVAAPQTTVTDAVGNFRFIGLGPGTYSLRAELAGYGAATRSGISVRVAQNADVTMTLNPSVAESITVTAEAPLLDVRKAGTGIDVSKVELQNVPTGRDPWVIMQQTPGVLMDRVNVGGSESGQQSGYVSKGQTSDQSSWNVDGVAITDVGALGSTPTYYDFDSFEEMQITTGGSDPRIKTPGIQMNFVTKRGTNDFKGSGRWFQTNRAWQAKPTIPSEAQSYLKLRNQIDRIEDRGLEIGGPILKDRLWAWGSFSRNNINLLTATLLSSGARFTDKTLLENENVKLNAQVLTSNSIVFTDMYGNKVKLGRNASPSRPPETTWNQADVYRNNSKGSLFNPTTWKIEDTQIFGSSLYLTGLYSEVQGGFHLVADAGTGCRTFDCSLAGPVSYQDSDGVWRRNYLSYESVRPSSQARLDGSKFFDIGKANNELKFGFGYRNAGVRSLTAWAGSQYTTVADVGGSQANTGGVQLTRSPETDFHYKVKYQDFYVGDTILLGNLTVQAAVRYDKQTGRIDAGTLGANPTIPDIIPAVSWNAVSGLKWTNVSPRIGVTYALGAAKRTLLRASYNRYADALGGSLVYLASPGNYSYMYFYFKDLNGDHIAQRNEIDIAYGPQAFNAIDPKNPAVPQQYYRWGNNLKSPTTDEFIGGFEQELLTDFSVGVNGTYRKLRDFIWHPGEKTQGKGDIYSSADFMPAATPKTITLPNGQTVTLPYYVLKPGIDAPTFFVFENRPDYNQTYKSLDLFATKRLSNRWMMRGNFTWQDWKQHVGARAIIDPTRARGGTGCTTCDNSQVIIGAGSGSGAHGGVYLSSKWAYNITGTYQIPVIETNFGVNLTGRQGYPIPYVFRVTGPGGVNGEGGTVKPILAENQTDTFRHPNLTELDLRLAKDIRIWRGGVTFSVDAFNVLNKATTLQRDVRRLNRNNAGAPFSAANHITELQSPRVLRLGLRVSF